ncbi:hypothetical protein KIH41_10335 [Litoribacter ruber]|uniref:Uncharacterized protein n=1 Tax=Litoribacter ruber TaxID=702568 RepID=A0AAP2CJQ8_9BACT|nr:MULTISPECIES: hypothetical protein [Litoribacter]MBS9525190.1 hypothetical protein [Litoribacter alkaliphilus]MBT0811676.1 hypothetical protein [Litoribacter ruber]
MRVFKISLFLAVWTFIIVFSLNIAGTFDPIHIAGYETFFLKMTYPVLLFLVGAGIFKYFKILTPPLLVITTITCFFFVGKEYSNMIYLLPVYLLMYLGGYFGADWYEKNIQLRD